jgi:hypothetical protein
MPSPSTTSRPVPREVVDPLLVLCSTPCDATHGSGDVQSV